jgi:hypothetical protein
MVVGYMLSSRWSGPATLDAIALTQIPTGLSGGLRAVRGGITFLGVVGAAAGAYVDAVVAGLLALVTGQVFDAGSPWPAGAGVLALMGAVGATGPDSPVLRERTAAAIGSMWFS